MEEMRYEAPSTLDAAVALLSGASAPKLLAGGTDVLVQLHIETIEPDVIVDIKNIPEMKTMAKEADGWRVGAAVPAMEMLDNAAFCKDWPGVIEGVVLIGSMQVKGRATVAGNVCNGSPAADSTPAMIAAGAIATVIGPKGQRQVPVEDIVIGPGKISLAKDEFIVSFLLPAQPAHSGDCYMRLTPRTEMDIAVVGTGACLTLDDSGTCTAARVSLGAVAPTPLLVQACADAIIGTKVDDAALTKLGEAASAACNPISDKRGTKEYRIKTAAVIARRVVEKALERAKAN
jgi:carbon-monoxide dehydrogenase medium subunit